MINGTVKMGLSYAEKKFNLLNGQFGLTKGAKQAMKCFIICINLQL
jgi:hypothetical protein